MTVFSDFSDAGARFEQAEEIFKAEQARYAAALAEVAPFKKAGSRELEKVLKSMGREGLFPGVDNSHHYYEVLDRYNHLQMSPQAIPMLKNSEVTHMIVAAAKEKNLPVEAGPYNELTVASSVMERQKCPEILLRALGAYAKSKGNASIEIEANAAADRMVAFERELLQNTGAGQNGAKTMWAARQANGSSMQVSLVNNR